MCMRNYKQALWRGQVNDYSLSGLQGKELHDLTVGVMGTGNIGRTFVQLLSGFGCRILAYDLHENEDVKKYATYVDKDTLLKESDAMSLHLPLFESTYHLINKETIQKQRKLCRPVQRNNIPRKTGNKSRQTNRNQHRRYSYRR